MVLRNIDMHAFDLIPWLGSYLLVRYNQKPTMMMAIAPINDGDIRPSM